MDNFIKKVSLEYNDETKTDIDFLNNEHFRFELNNLMAEYNDEQSRGTYKRPTGERVFKLIIGPEYIIKNEEFFESDKINPKFSEKDFAIGFGQYIQDSLCGEDWFLMNKTVEELYSEYIKNK